MTCFKPKSEKELISNFKQEFYQEAHDEISSIYTYINKINFRILNVPTETITSTFYKLSFTFKDIKNNNIYSIYYLVSIKLVARVYISLISPIIPYTSELMLTEYYAGRRTIRSYIQFFEQLYEVNLLDIKTKQNIIIYLTGGLDIFNYTLRSFSIINDTNTVTDAHGFKNLVIAFTNLNPNLLNSYILYLLDYYSIKSLSFVMNKIQSNFSFKIK